jgi:hypothetical protein
VHTTNSTARSAPVAASVALLALALVAAVIMLVNPAQAHVSRERAQGAGSAARVDGALPPVGHVFVVNIENKDYDRTWGADPGAPYLAVKLRNKGVLLEDYYGTAHHSLGNYLAQISGQGVTPQIQKDCPVFAHWSGSGVVEPGQYVGQGCVFPAETDTLAGQLDRAGYNWRGYMEDMATPCRHPKVDAKDRDMKAEADDQYATKHNPFVYFHSIIDRPKYCKAHVVDLAKLKHDLGTVSTTRTLTYITPDLCSDGHDTPCIDGRPGGLRSVNAWMREWIPQILASPAYKKDGLLIITADESDGVESDSSACCGEVSGPNVDQAGIAGPGGGRIGALVLSRWVTPGSVSTTPYNHYALLASIEDLFGLSHLGFAGSDGLDRFGTDVYNAYRP